MSKTKKAPQPEPLSREERERQHREYWRIFWGWEGPKVGELCEVHQCIVKTEEGEPIYAYMEQCRLLEERPGNVWLAVIEMPDFDGRPWYKNGTRLLLELTDIWVPVRQIRAARRAAAGEPEPVPPPRTDTRKRDQFLLF